MFPTSERYYLACYDSSVATSLTGTSSRNLEVQIFDFSFFRLLQRAASMSVSPDVAAFTTILPYKQQYRYLIIDRYHRFILYKPEEEDSLMLIDRYHRFILYKPEEEDSLMLSSRLVSGGRRRKQTMTKSGRFCLDSLAFTIMALLTVCVQEVIAFNCENRFHHPTVLNVRLRKIPQFRINYADEKSLMLCGDTHFRIDEFYRPGMCLRHTRPLNVLKMSTKDDDIAVQRTDLVGAKSVDATTSSSSDSAERANNRGSLSRTLFMAVPLMLKFALVLMIKFLTDLVVFPLLFTYRGARIMKRRITKIWNRWTSSPSSTPVDNSEGESLNLEAFSVNGSTPSSD